MSSRRFVLIGTRALASGAFHLLDLPSSSGRLDVLLRCLRCALLFSHGLRRDTTVYLVLLGGPRAPRTLRVRGDGVRFLRPDERSLAITVQRALLTEAEGPGFVEVRPGLAVAEGGLDALAGELGDAPLYLLDEAGPDLRDQPIDGPEPVFFLGDHLGLDEASRAWLAARGARSIAIGPVSLHTEDALAVLVNELDRRGARPG
ncbi:MAG: hypothetical protein U0359_04780 [Byssovorax sp.]